MRMGSSCADENIQITIMYAHVPCCRLASCVLLCRLLEIAESVSSLHIYRLMPSYILLPSCLIPWNRSNSTSFQSLLHDIMVREKSVLIIFLFAVRNSYVSEFYCIR